MNAELLVDQPEVSVSDQEQIVAHACADHNERLRAINDAMDVLSGKWKLQLLGLLLFKGKMRFGELMKHIDGIGAKMLSKELHNLEMNKIITRTVLHTKPVTVEYEMTPYGRSLEQTVLSIVDWGMNHRREILKGDS